MTRILSRALSRRTAVVMVVVLLAVTAAGSATVYEYFYANSSATIRTPDVTLVAGTDASPSCSAYPCTTVGISGTHDTATVSLSIFKADNTFSPVPATYYTNLIAISDTTNAHTVLSVSLNNVASTRAADFGQVTVYYCSPQCTFGPTGVQTGGTALGSCAISSAGPCTVFSGTQSIAASTSQYVEIVVYGGSGAAVVAGDAITFQVAVQWV